jgi:hypothetical protein
MMFRFWLVGNQDETSHFNVFSIKQLWANSIRQIKTNLLTDENGNQKETGYFQV